ncbi:BrnA antitoxin family protein [soil metagenome]
MQKHSEPSQTNWAKIDALTAAEIESLAAADEGEIGVEWDWDNVQVVLPESKKPINLRVDAEVIRFFRAQGPGYQTRMNAVLRAYVAAQRAKQAR